tara:strand:+ start:8838 stop:9242 length:405 start_codon:yes stop_codon:yes gene_type:complete
MNKSELKKVLKPLIKQTIREVILEEGLLSNIVAEVAKGLNGNLIAETKQKGPSKQELERRAEEAEKQRQEKIRRLNESMKSTIGGVNVFEGTKPVIEESQKGAALAGVSPDDSGVDISGIMNIANGKWKTLAGN